MPNSKWPNFTINLPQFDRDRHGSLWDRGQADSWYSRPDNPHWYPEGTYNGDPVTDLTVAEKLEYYKGYLHNEKYGGKKEWE